MGEKISRRDAIKKIGLVTAGAAANNKIRIA